MTAVTALLALLAMSAAAATARPLAAPLPMQADVIVVGGGFAGMKAASDLVAGGVSKVIVLEARGRVGGRAWSESMSAGGKTIWAEMGAAWVHGVTNNPITALAKTASVDLSGSVNYGNNQLYNGAGKEVNDTQETKYDNEFNTFYKYVTSKQDAYRSQYKANSANDPGLKAIMDQYISDKKLTGDALTAFRYEVNVNVEHEYSGSAGQLSLYFDGDSELGGGDKFVIGGYQKMVEDLAKGVDVRLNTKVVSINTSSSSAITLTTAAGQVFTATRVVCAVPLGVLQKKAITFTPALPAENQAAIDKLGMGLLNKVVLAFNQVFWPAGVEFLNKISPAGDGAWQEMACLNKPTGAPVLVAFNAATYAASLEAKTDQQTVAEVMAVLRSQFPNAPNPTSYNITRWASDPLAFGSYSFLAKGAAMADRTRSGAAVANSRLLFAGEHTRTDYPATTHGALLSGKAAACTILQALSKKCPA